MSGILLRWLNEDLRLKQRVLNLDHNFSNGYLLGEILHVHNHQHDFNLFQDSSTAEARATNFILLEPPLRLLGVPFDVQVAYNIMNGKPGMAGKLLYQMKMVLDRLTKFSVPVSMRPTITSAGVQPLPNLPQRTAKPQYDRATHAIFSAAIGDMVQGKRGSSLDRSLQRFEAEGARQKRHVQIEKERSVLAEELHTEAIRVQGIHKLAQRKALCNSWEATNVDSWLMNMGLKRNRELRNHLFRQTMVKARLVRVQNSHMVAKTAVQVDIPDFEARSKGAARAVSSNQEEDEATPWAFTASTRGFLEARALDSGYEWQMEKFHAKRSGERTLARKKRRRRYTTEREESLSKDHFKEGTDVLKQKLMKRCRAEEQVDRQLESVFRYKAIMTENRKYRKQQYTMRADVDAEGLLKRDQASLDSDRRDYDLLVRSHAERCDTAGATRVVSAATRVEKTCRETLEGILALSMEVVRYRVYSEHYREPDATAPQQDPMPVLQWMDLKRSFVRGGPLVRMDIAATVGARDWGYTPLLPLAVGEGGHNAFWASHTDDETAEEVASFLDTCEFEDYINETGWWATQREPLLLISKTGDDVTSVADVGQADPEAHEGRIEMTDSDEADAANLLAQSDFTELVGSAADGNILNTANPLHALGECVIETSLAANPLRAPEPPPAVPKFSMRLCMCGKTLTGKSEQAIRLADRYCLKVLSAEELAQRALDNAANAMAAGRKTLSREEALGQEASSALLQGGTISDKVYAALLVEAIKGIEEDNRSSRAELKNIRGGQGSSPDDDRTEYMGWVIDDFPGNADQAAVLEKHLSGYDERTHVPSRKDAASKLAPMAPVPLEHKEKIPSGIDMVIYIETPRETVLQRSLGRLFDPFTGENYHFEGSLPQYDVVCKERLVRPEDPANPSSQLSLQVAAEEQSSEELKAFLDRFGTLRTVESGLGTPDALFGKLNSVVLAMIQEVQENDDTSITNGEVVDNDNVASEGGEKKDSGDNLEGGADPNSPSTVDPSATLGPVDDEPGRLEQQQAAAGGEKASSSPGDGNLSSTLENATGNVYELQEKAPRRELLTGELAVAVSGHWRAAEQQFEGTARQVFRELRNQRLQIGSHVRFLRDSFSDFLHRPDDKQTNLSEFCASFNSIEQDLRFDDRARKELLLRTEECRSRLWLDIEEREACAAGMLRTHKEDGWLERQKGMISNHMIILMQAEVERFHAGTTLLNDYHDIKTQEVAREDTVVLVPLLPPDTEGTAPKGAPPRKTVGKKDKDGKGGGKKEQEGKGAKRRKSTVSGEPPSGPRGARTALPPCLTPPSLVEVIVAGGSSQLVSEAEESGAPVGQGKGKGDRNKKAPKRPTGGKTDSLETEEAKPPLAAALSMVLDYADAWGPEGFPVPEETEEEFSTAADTATDGEPVRPRKPPPSPLLRHRAVWAQADLLATRCQLLLRTGEVISSSIQKKADMVYSELQSCLDARVLEETTAVETAMAKARDDIDCQSFVEHEWQLQGGSFSVDESFRLVPMPEISPPFSAAPEKSEGVLSESQVLRLQDALNSILHTGRRGDELAVVAPEDVVDALLRLSEEEGALPECWSCASKEHLMQFATRVLDPDDIGQVEVEKVVSSIASTSIQDHLKASETPEKNIPS